MLYFYNESIILILLSSIQFSHSVVSDSLWPHEPQHTRPPCLSPTPRVYPNSCPSSRWCHPTISSSVLPFSSCPQYFPASGSFPKNQLFAWGGQSIGVSASASVLPMNTQDWSPLGWTGQTQQMYVCVLIGPNILKNLELHPPEVSCLHHSLMGHHVISNLFLSLIFIFRSSLRN